MKPIKIDKELLFNQNLTKMYFLASFLNKRLIKKIDKLIYYLDEDIFYRYEPFSYYVFKTIDNKYICIEGLIGGEQDDEYLMHISIQNSPFYNCYKKAIKFFIKKYEIMNKNRNSFDDADHNFDELRALYYMLEKING